MPTNSTGGVADLLSGDYMFGTATKKPLSDAVKAGNDLDKDAFLKLLMAQLQYQDPLNPMSDTDFIAQMAQFSALEQMQNMNNAYAKSQAYDMIGRRVDGMNYIEGTNSYSWVDGIVLSVKTVNGEPFLTVKNYDGKEVDMALKRVENVYENVVQSTVLDNINTNIANQQYLTLVGQMIQAITRDEDLNPTGYVEGEVTAVRFGAGGTKIIVGNRELDPAEVIAVGKDSSILLLGRELYSLEVGEDGVTTSWQSGSIAEIRTSGNGFVMVLSNGTRIPVDNLNDFTQAYSLMGELVAYAKDGGVLTGIVSHVGIRSGEVVLSMGDGDFIPVLFKDVSRTS